MRGLAALLAVSTSLGIVACGVDPSEPEVVTTTVESEAPSDEPSAEELRAERRAEHAAFVEEADAICRRANRRIERINLEGLTPESEAEAVRLVEEGRRKLDALAVPEGLETKWEQYLAAVDQQARFEARGDLEERDRARDRKAQVALDIGFVVCGTG